MHYRNLVQFVGYETPMHMNEEQFNGFWQPIVEPYIERGGVTKVILSQHRSGYFNFDKTLPYMYLSKNWWLPGPCTKTTLISGRSGKIGHCTLSQLGVFELREWSIKNRGTSHLAHTPDKDIIKLMGMVSVDDSNCDLSEPYRLGETLSKIQGYQAHSIYELHPVAREFHSFRRRNRETTGNQERCPCRVAGWIVEVYFNTRDVNIQGVCKATDQFYQTYKNWKFAFHKDIEQLDSNPRLVPDNEEELCLSSI